jgi:predicted nucleic acid-binding protein
MQDEELHAPALVDSEVANAIRKRELARQLEHEGAEQVIETWRHLGIRRHLAHGHLERIWALRHNLTAYDATYVALAESLECELLTADGRLAVAPDIRCTITRVAT